MKLKYEFEIVQLIDDFVAVPAGRKAEHLNGIYRLNREGKELFELLRKETTVEAIVSFLLAKYENEESTLRKYVCEFTDKLKKDGVLE